MKNSKAYPLIRASLFILLFVWYSCSILLQMTVLFSPHSNHLIHSLAQHRWPLFLLVGGLLAGVYLTISAALILGGNSVIYEQNKLRKKLFFSYLAFFFQLFWIGIPTLLVCYTEELKNFSSYLLMVGILLFIALLAYHRMHLKTIAESF